jgi:hypothetical protein
VGQLFSSLDPSPCTERDLDDDAKLASSAGPVRSMHEGRSGSSSTPVGEVSKARERNLGTAIGHFLAYRVDMLERDRSDLFRVGRRSLAIGIAVLAVTMTLSQVVRAGLPERAPAQLLAEGIMIFGWVANWRPAEIFLYDVWAARRRLDLYRRLAGAQVELKPF